ncbi:hypothetical protein GCM10008066_05770 [Oxalicibacterium faecigallinarum]|uniref:AsmA domain-containing protein n=2 Tax=Oxalicibacterium faecigallinarum TaxID=573741 RepID=A0A8J3ANC7_9BURK|nr:hypothetical protein GCM10008066_05770 [Oxalicibacterium faecigallinarum]
MGTDKMRRWQKWALGGALLAVLLFAIAVIYAHRLADSGQLRQIAQDKVQEKWSRELHIGDLSVSLLPFPHLQATDVSLDNPDWAQDRHLFQASRISARFALLPLLRGRFVLESLRFEGLKGNLEIAEDGRRSWELSAGRKLQAKDIDLTDLHLANSVVQIRSRGAEPVVLEIDKLDIEASPQLRNVEFDGLFGRNGQSLELKGEFANLASFGIPGASTGGMIFAKIAKSTALLKGTFPISLEPQNYAFSATIDAPEAEPFYRFLAIERRPPVPLKLDLQVQGSGQKLYARDIRLQLGKRNLLGDIQFDRSATRPVFHANLHADRIDMTQTMLDLGNPPLPVKPQGELFYDRPLPWKLLSALQGMDGSIDAHIDALRLRNGIEVRDAKARASTRDDVMTVSSFEGKLLGGSAKGSGVFAAKSRHVTLDMRLDQTELGQWFAQTGKKARIDGGKMQVDMRVETQGESMKQLAAHITGPLDIRIGPAKIHSEQAGQAEYWLNGIFSAKDASRVDMACLAARLPFRNGVAKGSGIVGGRSEASQLLTSGIVDMRSQTLELQGKIRARAGISLGISTFANDIKIAGRVGKPDVGLDEAGAVGALARIGAAIVTSGISIVATSIWDGANPESDPCQVVFARK